MNIVDSSAWLEYFAGTKNAKFFAKTIENTSSLLVPSITIYEVFKKILLEKDEHCALTAIAHMRQGKMIDLDLNLSIEAATIGKDCRLPMADSIIMATAIRHNATIWTMDSDFKGKNNVKYFKK